MKTNMKTTGYTMQDCERFVELMARAKAVWADPKLLDLTEKADSPTQAYEIVLAETGKRRKALAARWYKIVCRDYHPDLASACGRWLRFAKDKSKQISWRKTYNLSGLRDFLFNALAEDYIDNSPGEKI